MTRLLLFAPTAIGDLLSFEAMASYSYCNIFYFLVWIWTHSTRWRGARDSADCGIMVLLASPAISPSRCVCTLFATVVVLCSFYGSWVRADSGANGRVAAPLVTGCGRGGTHSTAMMLNKLGVNTAHESFSHEGVSVGWPYGAPLGRQEYIGYDWEPKGRYPFEKEKSYRDRMKFLAYFEPVVLLVRNPIDVISSTRRCFCAKGKRETKTEILNDGRSWVFVEHNLNLEQFLKPGTGN